MSELDKLQQAILDHAEEQSRRIEEQVHRLEEQTKQAEATIHGYCTSCGFEYLLPSSAFPAKCKKCNELISRANKLTKPNKQQPFWAKPMPGWYSIPGDNKECQKPFRGWVILLPIFFCGMLPFMILSPITEWNNPDYKFGPVGITVFILVIAYRAFTKWGPEEDEEGLIENTVKTPGRTISRLCFIMFVAVPIAYLADSSIGGCAGAWSTVL